MDFANLEEVPRVLGDAVGDEHDHVAPRAGVADGLAQDAHAEDELVAVQQRDVGLLRRRQRPGEQRHRDEGGGQEGPPARRRSHRRPARVGSQLRGRRSSRRGASCGSRDRGVAWLSLALQCYGDLVMQISMRSNEFVQFGLVEATVTRRK